MNAAAPRIFDGPRGGTHRASALGMRERNLAAYFADRPAQAQALRGHLCVGVERLASRSGAATLRYQGQYLHSSVDPVAEAERLFVDDRIRDAGLVVLFGLGAGHTLRALRQRSQARVVVFEPSPDVLAHALDTLDLRGDELLRPDALAGDLESLRLHLPNVHLLGDEIAFVVTPPYLRVFQADAEVVSAEVRFFADQAKLSDNTYDLRMRLWIDNVIDNLPERTRLASATALEGRFAGVPGIVVSAGPSLAGNIHILRELQDRAVIVSTNTAYRALERAGVTPDLVIGLEALDVGPQFRGAEKLGETLALLDGVTHPSLFALPFAGGFIFDDGIPFYQHWLIRHLSPVTDWSCGMCVAHAAYSAVRQMGCDPIVLVGQDLAHTGGRVYAQGTVFESMTATASDSGDTVLLGNAEVKREIDRRSEERSPGMQSFAAEEPRVRVPGYHGGEVDSTLSFRAFARWFENAAVRNAGERTLLNCTEGGARINGFEQRPLRELAASAGGPRGVKAALREAASRPAQTVAHVAAVCEREARELWHIRELIAEVRRSARSAGQSAGAASRHALLQEKLQAAMREHSLLNGYVRKALGEVRRDARAGEDRDALWRRLHEVVWEAAGALASRLERAAQSARSRAGEK